MINKLMEFERENAKAFQDSKVLNLALDLAVDRLCDGNPALYTDSKSMKAYFIKCAFEEVN